MIETPRLKNVVTFFQTILSFVLSRKIINIYNDIAWKYGNVTVTDFQKYEKLEYKKNELKLDIDFHNNCKQRGNSLSFNCRMFLIKTLYQFVKDSFIVPSIRVIKTFNMFQKISVHSYCPFSLQKKLQHLWYLAYILPIFTANKTITNLTQYELSQEEPDLLKARLYFSAQPDKIRKSKIFTTFG